MSHPQNSREKHDALRPEALEPEDRRDDTSDGPDRDQADSPPETDSDSAHRAAR